VTIDALMLLGENRFGRSISADEAIAIADEHDIAKVVAAPARPLDYHLEPANERLAQTAAASGGRIVALARVDPLNRAAATREAERALGELGCAGIFLHPGEEVYSILAARDVFKVGQKHCRPVVVAAGYQGFSEPLQIAQVAGDFPDLPVVLTTGGQINISGLSMIDAWLALTSHDNLCVMTNGEYRQDFIERLAAEFDPARVIYGSFAPLFDPAFELRRVRSAVLKDEARRLIEHENALRLFGPLKPSSIDARD
jgi:uncharacterized protein